MGMLEMGNSEAIHKLARATKEIVSRMDKFQSTCRKVRVFLKEMLYDKTL